VSPFLGGSAVRVNFGMKGLHVGTWLHASVVAARRECTGTALASLATVQARQLWDSVRSYSDDGDADHSSIETTISFESIADPDYPARITPEEN
jgi:hypothetical protein